VKLPDGLLADFVAKVFLHWRSKIPLAVEDKLMATSVT
jgi:hypothetical protein